MAEPGSTEWLFDSIPVDAYLAFTELVIAGVNAYVIRVIYKICRSNEAILRVLRNTSLLTVGSELTYAVESTESGILPYAAIRGKVNELGTGQVIAPSKNGISSVIKCTEQQEIRSKYSWNGRRYTFAGQTSETQEFHPFCLRPLSEYPISINFQSSTTSATSEAPKIQYGSLPLLIIKDISIPDITDLLQTFPTYFEKMDRKESSFFKIFEYIFGFSTVTGLKKTDKLLPVNEIITAFGRVTKTGNGQYTLTAPSLPNALYKLTRTPFEEIIEEYSIKTTVGCIVLFIFTCGGVLLIVDAVKRLKSIYCTMYPEQDFSTCDNIEAQNNYPLSPDGTPLCVICHERPRNVVLLNCKHFCTCETCSGRLNGRCPVCRRKVVNSFRIYVS